MIEAALSLVGIIGLIGGNLTISRDHPLKGPRARIAGLILAMALPLSYATLDTVFLLTPSTMQGRVLGLLDPLPAITVIVATSAYLYATNPDRQLSTILFWITATVPAAGLFIARNLLFHALFWSSMGLPLPRSLRLHLPDIVIGVLIPLTLAFAANLLNPVANDRGKALSFAIPVASLHALYYAVSDRIRPAISSIAYPGGTPGGGYIELINGMGALAVSALLMGLVAFASLSATKIRGAAKSAALQATCHHE